MVKFSVTKLAVVGISLTVCGTMLLLLAREQYFRDMGTSLHTWWIAESFWRVYQAAFFLGLICTAIAAVLYAGPKIKKFLQR